MKNCNELPHPLLSPFPQYGGCNTSQIFKKNNLKIVKDRVNLIFLTHFNPKTKAIDVLKIGHGMGLDLKIFEMDYIVILNHLKFDTYWCHALISTL